MPTFITRLDLSSGRSLEVGQLWLEGDKYPVGLIIDRPEVSVQLGDDDGGGSEPNHQEEAPPAIERVPAHYEVWLLPVELCKALFSYYHDVHAYETKVSNRSPDNSFVVQESARAKNVVCRRVPASVVLFSEEVISFAEARVIVHDYFADKLDIPDEAERPRGQPQQLGAPNGADAR